METQIPVALRTEIGRRFRQLLREEERLEQQRREKGRREFREGWKRSKKKNLWREWSTPGSGQVTMTIFRDRRSGYSFCIAGPSGPVYSAESYISEAAAQDALAEMCTGGSVNCQFH